MIYTLYVYNRNADCLLMQQWNKQAQKKLDPATEAKTLEHEQKNMFGLLFSMKQFVNTVNPYR